MSTLNIGGDKADASYRYKMPALVTKIEGRGNGIKTVILNMHELAKSLHVHPAYPTKYFGIELGAQSKFSASSDRAVVNGAHQPGDLAKILERFIAAFILCPVCKLPELKMSVKSSIKIDCAACGHNSTIKTSHKLAQYIIKNPPAQLVEEERKSAKKKVKPQATAPEDEEVEEKQEKKKGGKREHKKDKKKKKGEQEAGGDAADDGDDAQADGEDEQHEAAEEEEEEEEEEQPVKEKVKSKKKEERKEERKAQASSPSAGGSGKAADVWYTDTSKEAQQARKEAEFREQRDAAAAGIEAILLSSKQEKTAESPLTTLKIFLAHGSRSAQETQAELKRITLARQLDVSARNRLVLEAITDIAQPKDAKAAATVFHTHSQLLASLCPDRASSVSFLYAVEELLGSLKPQLLSSAPHVLKQLYDDDVCDEDAIVSWFDAPPESSWLVKKDVSLAVRAKAKVFVDWLKNTAGEEEDEEGDEEEEDDDAN